MEHVAGEVSRAILPHLGEEDFVTAILAQITPRGELTIVNCGHHPPLLRHGGDLQPLTGGTAALPLGLEGDFTAFTASWSPGDRLLLYTDGLVESRDQHGDFLPEDIIAMALVAADCEQALDTLMTACTGTPAVTATTTWRSFCWNMARLRPATPRKPSRGPDCCQHGNCPPICCTSR